MDRFVVDFINDNEELKDVENIVRGEFVVSTVMSFNLRAEDSEAFDEENSMVGADFNDGFPEFVYFPDCEYLMMFAVLYGGRTFVYTTCNCTLGKFKEIDRLYEREKYDRLTTVLEPLFHPEPKEPSRKCRIVDFPFGKTRGQDGAPPED